MLGEAIVRGDAGPNTIATVYAAAIAERSRRDGTPLATLIGRVSAHEIGHLLLGANNHSLHGLMRPKWDVTRAGADDWLFSRVDADTIRHNLAVRAATRSAAAIGGDSFEELGD